MPRGRQTLPDARGPLQNGVRCHRPRGDGSNSQGNHAVLHGAELEHGSERDVQFGPRCRLRPRSLTRTIRRRIRRVRIGITGLWVMADGIFLLGDDITLGGAQSTETLSQTPYGPLIRIMSIRFSQDNQLVGTVSFASREYSPLPQFGLPPQTLKANETSQGIGCGPGCSARSRW